MSPLPPDFREWTCEDVLNSAELTRWLQADDPSAYDFCVAELEKLRQLGSLKVGIIIGCCAAGLGYLLLVLYRWYKARRDSLPPPGATHRVWLRFDVSYLNPFSQSTRVPAPAAVPADDRQPLL